MAKLVARLLATAALGANPAISQKIQNGRQKQRRGQHNLARQKYTKNPFLITEIDQKSFLQLKKPYS
jgi:hypothetical protein